jgi:O-antigen/teichoic acid export membrane protein
VLTLVARARRAFASTESALAKAVTLSILGRFGYLAVGFAASIGLARFLGPANRGLFGLMLSILGLALVLTGLGVPLAIVYFASRQDVDHRALLGNSLVHAAILTAVLVPFAAVFYPQLADAFGHGDGGRTWILVALLVPITFLDWTTHGQLQGLLMFGRFNLLLVLSRLAYAIGLVALLGWLDLGVAGALLATALGSAVMIFGSLGPVLRFGWPRLNAELARRTLHYGARVQVGSIFQLANGRLDVIVLQFFRPLSQVGYYVVAQAIAELVITLANAFQSSVLPLVSSYEDDEHAAAATTVDSIRHHGILAAVAVLANVVFGSLVIYFAFGPQYRSAIAPMLILLPGIWFLGVGIVVQGDLGGRGRPGLSSALAALAACVTVVLDFALIPPLGVFGGAIASVLAYTTFGVASLVALSRVAQIPLRVLVIPERSDFARYAAVFRRARNALRPPASDSASPSS